MKTHQWRQAQRSLFFIFLAAVIWFVPGAAQAGNQDLFVEKCGSCHGKGKEAAAVNPSDYAASQWKNYFKRNKHQRKKRIGHLVSEDEFNAIRDYLMDNAADSDHPVAAAIPK